MFFVPHPSTSQRRHCTLLWVSFWSAERWRYCNLRGVERYCVELHYLVVWYLSWVKACHVWYCDGQSENLYKTFFDIYPHTLAIRSPCGAKSLRTVEKARKWKLHQVEVSRGQESLKIYFRRFAIQPLFVLTALGKKVGPRSDPAEKRWSSFSILGYYLL